MNWPKNQKAKIPPTTKKKLLKELDRLQEMGPMAPEASYLRTYLESVLELPWGKYSDATISLNKSKKLLDRDHYGLKDVKERILEYLSVIKLKINKKIKILK